MKKIYILATMIAFAFTANAQIIEDDMELYTLGELGSQNPTIWSVWSGDTSDGTNFIVTEDQALSGSQSLLSEGGNGDDPLLLLGNLTAGTYTLVFNSYIPAGKGGYINVQGETEGGGAGDGGSGVFNSSDIYYNNGGSAAGIMEDTTTGETASYPEDTWFETSIFFDVDNATYQITVNGNLLNADPVDFQTDTTLGGVNFFPVDANHEQYIDDVLFQDGVILATDEFSAANFSVYPNPVQNRLNIQSNEIVDAITVYDVLGKVVISTTPGVISPSVDMSALSSGAYLVNVSINGASKTVKVVK